MAATLICGRTMVSGDFNVFISMPGNFPEKHGIFGKETEAH